MIYSGSYNINNSGTISVTNNTSSSSILITTNPSYSNTASTGSSILTNMWGYVNSEDILLENEKFIKEKNFTYVNENDLYLTKDNKRVFIKKSENGFTVIWDEVSIEYKNIQSVLAYVDSLGYTINTNTIPILYLVKRIANLKDKLNLI